MENTGRQRFEQHTKFTNCICIGLLFLVTFVAACLPRSGSSDVDLSATNRADAGMSEPAIEVSPVSAGDGNYKLVSSDSFKLTVNAPGASDIELFYQPVTAGDRALLLKTISKASSEDVFMVDVKIPEDFNGEVWGRVKYPGGDVKETAHVLLAKRTEQQIETAETVTPSNTPDTASGSARTAPEGEESARSDKFTGGRVQRATL